MKIGYFCYKLSGNGPRNRARDIINGIAERTDHDVVVLTNEPDLVSDDARTIVPVSIRDVLETFFAVRRNFRDCDVVHVPINVYQLAFVRAGYGGPIVGGIGPGFQYRFWHVQLVKLSRIAVKINKYPDDSPWVDAGFDCEICTGTIDRERYYPYDSERICRLREDMGLSETGWVSLYVGNLNEAKGAGIVDRIASEYADDDTTIIVAGTGPLEGRIESNPNIRYEGYVPNDALPDYYNVADITLGPRDGDVTSNVGLESVACGTPYISTAEGPHRIFSEAPPYILAERTPRAVWDTARRYLEDAALYEEQVEKGFETFEHYTVTLEDAIDVHVDVYQRLA